MCVAKKNYFFIVCLMLLLLISCGLSYGEAQFKNLRELSTIQDLVINSSNSTDENKDDTQEKIVPTPTYSSLVKPTVPPSRVPKQTMTVTATRIGMTRYFSPGPPSPPHDSPPEAPHHIVLPAPDQHQIASSSSVHVEVPFKDGENNVESNDSLNDHDLISTNVNKTTNKPGLVLIVIPTPTVKASTPVTTKTITTVTEKIPTITTKTSIIPVTKTTTPLIPIAMNKILPTVTTGKITTSKTTTVMTTSTQSTSSDSELISPTLQTLLRSSQSGGHGKNNSDENDKENWDNLDLGNYDDNDNDEEEVAEALPDPVPLVSPNLNYGHNESPNSKDGQLEEDFADAFNNSEQNHQTRRRLRNVIARRRIKKLRARKLNDTLSFSGFNDHEFYPGTPEHEEERPNSFNQGPYRSTYVPPLQTTTATTTTIKKLPTRPRMSRRFRSTTTTTTEDPVFETMMPTQSSFVTRFAITEVPPPSFASNPSSNIMRSGSSSPILLKSPTINYESRNEDDYVAGNEMSNGISNPEPQIERPMSILYTYTEQSSDEPTILDNRPPSTVSPSTLSSSLPIATPSTSSEELRLITSTAAPAVNIHNNETGEWLQSEHSKHHDVSHDHIVPYVQGRDQWEKNYMNLQQTSFFNSPPSTEEISDAPVSPTQELLPRHDHQENFNATESGSLSDGDSGSKRSSSRQGLPTHSYNEDGDAVTIIEHHHHHEIPSTLSHDSSTEFYSDNKLSNDHAFPSHPHLTSTTTDTNSNNKLHSSSASSIFQPDSSSQHHQLPYHPHESSQGNLPDYFPVQHNSGNPYQATSMGSSNQAFSPYQTFSDETLPKPEKRSKKKQGSHYDRTQQDAKYVLHPYPSPSGSPKSFMDQAIFLDPSPPPTTKRRNNTPGTDSLDASLPNHSHPTSSFRLRNNLQNLPSTPPQPHFSPPSQSPFPFNHEFPPAPAMEFMTSRINPSRQHEAAGTDSETNSFNLKSPHATAIEDHFKAMKNSIVFKPSPGISPSYNHHTHLPPSSHSSSNSQSFSHFSSGETDKFPTNFKKESSSPVIHFHHHYPTDESGNTISIHETTSDHSYPSRPNDYSTPYKSTDNGNGPKFSQWNSGGPSDLSGSSLSSNLNSMQYSSGLPRNPKLLKPTIPGEYSPYSNLPTSTSSVKSNPMADGYQSISSGNRFREIGPSKAEDFSASHTSFASYHNHPPISSPPSLTLPMPGLVNIPTPPSESHAMNEVTPNRHFPPHTHSMTPHSDYEPANPPLPSGHILDQHFDHFVQNAGDFKDEQHRQSSKEMVSDHLPPNPSSRSKTKLKKGQYNVGHNFKEISSHLHPEASAKPRPSTIKNNYNTYKYVSDRGPNANSLDEVHYYSIPPPPQSSQFYNPTSQGQRGISSNSIPDYQDIETAGEPFQFDHAPPPPSPPPPYIQNDFSSIRHNPDQKESSYFGDHEQYPQSHIYRPDSPESKYVPNYKYEQEEHKIRNKPEHHENNKYKHELDVILQSLKGLKKEHEENSVSHGKGKENEEEKEQKPEEVNPYSETPYVLMFPNMIPPKTAATPGHPLAGLPSVPNLSLHKEVPFGSASEHFTPSPELGPGLKAVAVHPRLQMMKVLATKQYLSELEALQEKQRKPTTIYTPYGVLVPIGLSSSSNVQGSVVPPPKLKLSTSHSHPSHTFAETEAHSLHPYISKGHKGDYDHHAHHLHHHFPTDEKSLLNILLGSKGVHHAHKEVKEVKGKLKGGFRAAVDPALDILAEKLAIKLSALQYFVTHPPKSLEFHISSQPLSAAHYVNPQASYSELKPVSTSPAIKEGNKAEPDADTQSSSSTHNKAKSMFASMIKVKPKEIPGDLTSNLEPHAAEKDPSSKLPSPVFSKYLKSLLKDRLFEMLEESYQEKTANLAATTKKQNATPTSTLFDSPPFPFTKRDENKKSAQSSTSMKKGRQHPFALPSRVVTVRASTKLSRKHQDHHHHQQSQQQQQNRSHLPHQGGFLNAIKRLFSFGSGRQENASTNHRKHANASVDDIKTRMKNRGDLVNRRPVNPFQVPLNKLAKEEFEKLPPMKKENLSVFSKYGFKSAAQMEKMLRYLLKLKPLPNKDETQSSSEKEYYSVTALSRQESHNHQQRQRHPNHHSHRNPYSNNQQQQQHLHSFLPTTTNIDKSKWQHDQAFSINDLSTSSTQSKQVAMKIIPSPQLAPSNFHPMQSAFSETSKRPDNLSSPDLAYPANFLPMLNSWKPIPASISFTNDISSETSPTNDNSFQSRSFSVDSTNTTAAEHSYSSPPGELPVDPGQHMIQPRSL